MRLLEPLATGGMGEVWVAEHIGLDTKVAVKFIAPDLAAHPVAVERFHREAAISARLANPHIVRVFDHGTTHGVPYIIMELLQGETLLERLQQQGPMPLRATAEVILQVADGLTAAHAAGIFHRDIKPANIFLSESAGETWVKLLDFGVAGESTPRQSRLTQRGMLVGTPSYMTPEHVRDGHVTGDVLLQRQSDLWALTVVAYEALTNSLPFQGETLEELLDAISVGPFESPSRRCTGLGVEVDRWFERALHPSRHKRFETARELAQSFASLVPLRSSRGRCAPTRAAFGPQHSRRLTRCAARQR